MFISMCWQVFAQKLALAALKTTLFKVRREPESEPGSEPGVNQDELKVRVITYS